MDGHVNHVLSPLGPRARNPMGSASLGLGRRICGALAFLPGQQGGLGRAPSMVSGDSPPRFTAANSEQVTAPLVIPLASKVHLLTCAYSPPQIVIP